MSQQSKKSRERCFVERVAELLGKQWSLGPDREHPDFVVTEGEQRFGIEVCEIFTGRQSGKGSHKKIAESENQRAVNALRRAYEARADIPLTVKLVGDMCPENMAVVLRELVAMDLPSKPLAFQSHVDADEAQAGLRAHVTRAFRPDWHNVNDRVGWLVSNPGRRIAEEIGKKADKLPHYKESSGLDNIRLLIVANRIMNSGRMVLEGQPTFDVRGFQAVYFFSYPESVTTFDAVTL